MHLVLLLWNLQMLNILNLIGLYEASSFVANAIYMFILRYSYNWTL